MYDIETLRTGIKEFSAGLALMQGAGPRGYNHANPIRDRFEDSCGSPCCTSGWIQAASGKAKEYIAELSDRLGMPTAWECYLFMYSVYGGYSEARHQRFEYLKHDSQYETAVRRVKLWITYARRKLAIMEVEAGHWNDDDFLVGEARKQHLELVLA